MWPNESVQQLRITSEEFYGTLKYTHAYNIVVRCYCLLQVFAAGSLAQSTSGLALAPLQAGITAMSARVPSARPGSDSQSPRAGHVPTSVGSKNLNRLGVLPGIGWRPRAGDAVTLYLPVYLVHYLPVPLADMPNGECILQVPVYYNVLGTSTR